MKLEDHLEWSIIEQYKNCQQILLVRVLLQALLIWLFYMALYSYMCKIMALETVWESDQLAAGELLQQGHEDVSILYVLEKVMDLNGWVTLKMEGKKERKRELELQQ